jgi:hypothetical protein
MSLNVPKPNRARFAVRLNEMGSHPPVEQDVEFFGWGQQPTFFTRRRDLPLLPLLGLRGRWEGCYFS